MPATSLPGSSDVAQVREFIKRDLVADPPPQPDIFTVSSTLKSWIDHILRIRRTFRSLPEGKVGKRRDRPLSVVSPHGGDCGDTPPAQRNFLTSYVRIVFGTLGIRAVEFIQLEGMSRGPEAVTLSPDRTSGWIGQRLAGMVCGAALPGGRRPGQ